MLMFVLFISGIVIGFSVAWIMLTPKPTKSFGEKLREARPKAPEDLYYAVLRGENKRNKWRS